MNYTTKQANFIIENFDFKNISNFRKEFLESKSCQEISEGFQEQKVILKIDSDKVDLPSFENPIIVFCKNTCQIIYDNINKVVQIKTRDYTEDSHLVINLLNTLTQFKLQEIERIMISFMTRCNTKKKKLNIFNSRIHEKLSVWNFNQGFRVHIPIQNPERDYSEEYIVSKISGGSITPECFDDYVYQVVSNYIYEIDDDKANLKDRLARLELIGSSVPELNEQFVTTCEEIMNL